MKLKFFFEFVKNPIKLSTFVPTKRDTGRLMAEMASAHKAKTIVELGAAHGNVTREILDVMQNDSTLYSIETNKTLYKELCKINDKRLVPILGNALNLKELLEKHGVEEVDCVISTVPLAVMSRKKARKILTNVKSITKDTFVQIQYSKVLDKFLKRQFDDVQVEFRSENVPSVFLYKCASSEIHV